MENFIASKPMLNTGWQDHTPKEYTIALCDGVAYDGCWVGNKQYFIAEYMADWDEPRWSYGKQQNTCEVFLWKVLTVCV